MTLPNIALFGYAGAGKDTVAEYLVSRHQYTRIAFADPLKEMALSIDPIAYTGTVLLRGDMPRDEDGYRLSTLVSEFGWETVKRSFPEVRRFLRSLGKTMRNHDADFWLDQALEKIRTARMWSMPVVVTDVRHENEFSCLWECPNRFTMVRIDRPGTDTGDVDPESGQLIESVAPDWVIHNRGSVEDMHGALNVLINRNS